MYARSPPCARTAPGPQPRTPAGRWPAMGGADGRSPVRERADRALGAARRLRGAAGGRPRPRAAPAHAGRDRLPDRPARRAGPRARSAPGPRSTARRCSRARRAGRGPAGAASPARRCGPLRGRLLRGEPRPRALRPDSHRRGRTPRLRRALDRAGAARGRTHLEPALRRAGGPFPGLRRPARRGGRAHARRGPAPARVPVRALPRHREHRGIATAC